MAAADQRSGVSVRRAAPRPASRCCAFAARASACMALMLASAARLLQCSALRRAEVANAAADFESLLMCEKKVARREVALRSTIRTISR